MNTQAQTAVGLSGEVGTAAFLGGDGARFLHKLEQRGAGRGVCRDLWAGPPADGRDRGDQGGRDSCSEEPLSGPGLSTRFAFEAPAVERTSERRDATNRLISYPWKTPRAKNPPQILLKSPVYFHLNFLGIIPQHLLHLELERTHHNN